MKTSNATLESSHSAHLFQGVRELLFNPTIMSAIAEAELERGLSRESLADLMVQQESYHAKHYGNFSSSQAREVDRLLETDSDEKLRCFYECVAQKMTIEECVYYIKTTIGQELESHEIKDLKIIINQPRNQYWLDRTFWMVGIPVNMYGEVDCCLNDGLITYPWEWTVGGQPFYLPDVNCQGLLADDCCEKMMMEYAEEGIPLQDDNGNCLSCWVHQEPLEPVLKTPGDFHGDVDYLEHSWDPDAGECVVTKHPVEDVNTEDQAVKTELGLLLTDLDDLIDTSLGVTFSCSDLIDLWHDLLLYGRSSPHAMLEIPSLPCGTGCFEEESFILENDMVEAAKYIRLKLEKLKNELDSAQNRIIVYANGNGNVIEPPKIGGSRVGLDADLDDPDCPSCLAPKVYEFGGCENDCVCDPQIFGAFPVEDENGNCFCPDGQSPTEESEGVFFCPPAGQDCPAHLIGVYPDCMCPEGQLISPDRTRCCSETDPSCACPPPLTYDAATGSCWGCTCGFCGPPKSDQDVEWTVPCCRSNAAHAQSDAKCVPNASPSNAPAEGPVSNNHCKNDRFPVTYSLNGKGNVCAGAGTPIGNLQGNGCGCKPSRMTSCVLNANESTDCNYCSLDDLDRGDPDCDDCRTCLKEKCLGQVEDECDEGPFEDCLLQDKIIRSEMRSGNSSRKKSGKKSGKTSGKSAGNIAGTRLETRSKSHQRRLRWNGIGRERHFTKDRHLKSEASEPIILCGDECAAVCVRGGSTQA